MKNSKYLVFCDLDGVIFNFDKGVKDISGKYPAEFKSLWKEFMIPTIDSKIGFYLNLELLEGAKDLVDFLNSNIESWMFLSSTGGHKSYQCSLEKKLAVWNAFELSNCVTVDISFEKVKYITNHFSDYLPNQKILIDDSLTNVTAWRGYGGYAIHHTDLKRTLEELTLILKR